MITCSKETITPMKAAQYHDTMRENRPSVDGTTYQMIRELNNGSFHENGESLKFDEHGRLVDGGHRTYAISHTGKTVKMFVVRGLTPEAVATLDRHRRRSVGDGWICGGRAKGIDGMGNWNVAFSILNSVYPRERSRVINTTEAYDRMDKYYDGIRFVQQNWTKRYQYLSGSHIKGAFVRAYYYYPENRDQLERFINLLLGGVVQDERDITAKTLERALIDLYPLGRNFQNLMKKYSKVESAIKAFMDGKGLKRISCKPEVELFEI